MNEYIWSGVFSQSGQQKLQQAGGQPSSAGGPSQSVGMSGEFIKQQMSRLNVLPVVHLPRVTFAGLILGCIVVSILLQCNEAKQLDFENQEGKPCICNSTFYRSCPPAQSCLENNIPESTPPPRYLDPRDVFLDQALDGSDQEYPLTVHDDFDPDHVSDPWEMPIEYPRFGVREQQNLRLDSAGRIMRHRKVYLKPIVHNTPNVIHPINIRIPVKAPIIDEPVMPAPKPLFKMKKYITYERRPEIIKVPVTKTIIKPVGVSPDQIIQDDSLVMDPLTEIDPIARSTQ